MFLQIIAHGLCLIFRNPEYVAEPAPAENDLFAGTFGLVDSGIGVDLGGSDRSDERASGGEGRVEDCAICGLRA
jgi:hypothetical protein